MTLRLAGSTSGYTEIDCPSVGGNNTIVLPSGNGNANQLLKNGSTAGSLEFSSSVYIDSSQRLLVGTSTSRGNGSLLQVVDDASNNPAQFFCSPNNSEGPNVFWLKARGGSTGSPSIVSSGDTLGRMRFSGYDGSTYTEAASIATQVDGTPGNNDMPGRLVFSTTADGASSPTERARVTSTGHFKASNSGSYNSATAPYHELYNTQADWTVVVRNTNASPTGVRINHDTDVNGGGNEFLYCVGNNTVRASIRSNGGLANFSANNANLSDRNTKKNIAPAAGTWDCLKEWEIVNYRYKDQADDADLSMGVIAQQVAESCPEVITVFQEATEDQPEKLGVKEQQMMWMAIKALQEAQLRIETLEAKVAALEAS